jgi:hypothetical protein
MRAWFSASALFVLVACSGNQQKPIDPGPSKASKNSQNQGKAADTKVLSFAVSPDNLKVDAIGMTHGSFQPDGSRDHVFNATIDGPVDAIYIAEVNEKGEPLYGFRGSTVPRGEELPKELGGPVDVGSMTTSIGIVEKGHFVNGEMGAVSLPPGQHTLVLYAPNTAALQPGDFVRLWARSPNGGLAVSPVARY